MEFECRVARRFRRELVDGPDPAPIAVPGSTPPALRKLLLLINLRSMIKRPRVAIREVRGEQYPTRPPRGCARVGSMGELTAPSRSSSLGSLSRFMEGGYALPARPSKGA